MDAVPNHEITYAICIHNWEKGFQIHREFIDEQKAMEEWTANTYFFMSRSLSRVNYQNRSVEILDKRWLGTGVSFIPNESDVKRLVFQEQVMVDCTDPLVLDDEAKACAICS